MHRECRPDGALPARRHLTILLTDSDVADAIERMRCRWDPAMAAIAPAHVTVVYPEEASDEALLMQRLERQLAKVRSFPIDIRGAFCEDGGRGGVFLHAHDRVGTLTGVKCGLLTPPFTPTAFPLHVTVVHPRTSDRGPYALAAINHNQVIGSVVVSELCWTETSSTAQHVVQRFAVEAGEHAVIALARELDEELGIGVEDLSDLPTRVLSDDALNVDLSIWFVESWRGHPANVAPQEHDRLAWYTSEDWQSLPLAHQGYRRLLADAVGTH